ncbi:MAG: hypothetical protein ACR2P8_06015 [Myxococcota bacterium]
MSGASCRAWAARLARGIPALLLSAGCATPSLSVTEQGFSHRRHDYTIGRAPAGWERVDVDGAAIAYRRAHNTMSLQSRCGKPVAKPQLMARHLVIRLPDRTVVSAGPVPVAGRSGWAQVFDTAEHEVSVRVKTVTLVAQDCTFDWVLASTADFEAAESEFDAWRESFQLGLRYQEVGG